MVGRLAGLTQRMAETSDLYSSDAGVSVWNSNRPAQMRERQLEMSPKGSVAYTSAYRMTPSPQMSDAVVKRPLLLMTSGEPYVSVPQNRKFVGKLA